MMARMRLRWIAIPMLVAALAGCGHSRVVREPRPGGSRGTHGPVQVSQPRFGATVVVRSGQTVYRIATENGITALDLALWNDIAPPYTIYPGQRLRLYPRDGRPAPVARNPPATPRRAPTGTPAPRAPTTPAGPVEAARTANAPTWRWPTEGGVLTSYAAGDPTRQGIDIAGREGQPVRAAADGVVVYSGSGLVGYGELVIIKHNEQWLTAYGHNRARLVNEGTRVKAGDQVAEMGHSGASRDILHFEIRYNGKPVDPQQYLPRR